MGESVDRFPPSDWVCPACGAKVGEWHADECDVRRSRRPDLGTLCGPEEVRAPQEGYRKISLPPTCSQLAPDLHARFDELRAEGGDPWPRCVEAYVGRLDRERGPSRAKTATEVMKAEQYDAPADPWAHRSAKMRCRTCMWFAGKAKPGADPLRQQEFGRCRRHAPTMSGFPAVYGSDWCGDHKLDEAKA